MDFQNKSLSNEFGFSLVELMLVVAIIGVLASIAVPNFVLLREKAGQTEAKMDLSAVAAAEKIFLAEYNTYTSEFDQMSLGFLGQQRYNFGFASSFPDTDPGAPYHPPGGPCCHNGCSTFTTVAAYAPGSCDPNWQLSATWGCSLPFGDPDYPAGTVTTTTFNVMATGLLNSNGYSDIWTLDESGNLLNTQSGL